MSIFSLLSIKFLPEEAAKGINVSMATKLDAGDQGVVKREEEIEKSEKDSFQNENLEGEALESVSTRHSDVPATRTVELVRDPQWNLGISIVGGRQNEGDDPRFKGIFIKHVLETCPAGKSGLLKTGDQILQVCV